jgi:hypothetical protein
MKYNEGGFVAKEGNMKNKEIRKQSEFILYKSPDGQIKVDVYFHNKNIWLTQKRIAELFDVQRPAITKHLKNIFLAGELNEFSVSSILEHTASDGKQYKTKFYNLDVIISIGYRVNSTRATQFRIWATKTLREFIIKGFVLDDERLKNGRYFGKEYFDELLERIRDIRSSERRFYQKITDIYAQCSIDYDKDSDITQKFYATSQNKLHWAIHHHTAAELIVERVGSNKPNLGLTTWKNSPKGKIRKSDIMIAKNYLNENELKKLNRIVTMYLDYAELQAESHQIMTMKDWIKKLDAFLKFNEQDILQDLGKVSAEVAKELTDKEFEKYKKIEDRKYVSDFDKIVKKYLKKEHR